MTLMLNFSLLYVFQFFCSSIVNAQHSGVPCDDIDVNSVRSLFIDNAKENNYPGFAFGVVHDGALVLSGGGGFLDFENNTQADAGSLFRIASMTKSFVALAVLMLRDEGRISLGDPVEKYLPELKTLVYPTEDSPRITIEQLLTMTSGLPSDSPWADRMLSMGRKEWLQLLKSGFSFASVPSTEVAYSNLGYAILGEVISRVSGVSYQEFIRKQLWQPLGMMNTFWEYDKAPANHLASGYDWDGDKWQRIELLHDGAFGAIGGMITSIDDFSKYMIFHLSAWPPSNGADIAPVKRSTLREMHAARNSGLTAEAADMDGKQCAVAGGYGYGLGISVDCKGLVIVGHAGGLPGFGSQFRLYPDFGLGVVMFGNRTYSGRTIGDVLRKVAHRLVPSDCMDKKTGPDPALILEQRKAELIRWLTTRDETMPSNFLSGNVFMDKSPETWRQDIQRDLRRIGKIVDSGDLEPITRLKGKFMIRGERQTMEVVFSLTPHGRPKVQSITIRLVKPD